MRTALRRPLLALLVAVAPLTVAGCAATTQANVSGTVTYLGKALKRKAVLTFVGADNVPRSTETDDGGHFTIVGLPDGEVTVTVTPLGGGSTPHSLAATKDTPSGAPRPSGKSAPPSDIPPEYGDATHPRLRNQLQAGGNVWNIDLMSSPR
jgi:hypothetical protein